MSGTILDPILLLLGRAWNPPGDLVRILNGGDLADAAEDGTPKYTAENGREIDGIVELTATPID